MGRFRVKRTIVGLVLRIEVLKGAGFAERRENTIKAFDSFLNDVKKVASKKGATKARRYCGAP